MTLSRTLILAGCTLSGLFLAAGRAEAASQQRDCLVDSVAVIADRMHIKCVPIAGSAYTGQIPYYAMNLREGPAKIQGIIMLAVESKRRNKAMKIHFDMADYQSVAGCVGHNCRVLTGAIME
jgi:hypothetical protein